jgi:bacillithiol biosynthesis deacetylase BshB1
MVQSKYEVDLLAFGSHPDDVEIACGGSIIKFVQEGLKVAIVDLTHGEMGTRGTPTIRLQEAEQAKYILGATFRENLGLEDGYLEPNSNSIQKTVEVIRKYRPQIVLMSPEFERHPDHEALHRIVRRAMFLSGLRRFETQCDGVNQEPWRIRKMFCYMQSYPFKQNPDFYVDISDVWEKKIEAIRCYGSQVYIEGKSNINEPQTRLSRPEFFEELESRARYFGSLVGFRYAEAFVSVEPIGISSLSKLL